MIASSVSFTLNQILIMVALVVLYIVVRAFMQNNLMELTSELKVVSDELLRQIPGIADGSVLRVLLDRKDLEMTFDKDKAALVGMPTHKWRYNPFRTILNSDCMNVFEMWIFHYMHMHIPIERRLRFHLTFDGGKSYHWWELIYKFEEDNLQDERFYGLFVNIDKVKEIENAIEDSQKKVYQVEMQEAMLATINHDLRTPLNAVAGFSSLLAEQYENFTEEERKEFSQIVYSNSESMLKLMDIIKGMSESEIAERSYRPLPRSVSDLVNFSYNTNRIICPSHLNFSMKMPEGVEDKFVNIDSMRIERVLNNFISNAFKFTPVGEVVLGWNYLSETDQVELYVTDSGIGISTENQQKVFDEYIKLNEHAHGTGLGLNICKQIVEKHGGEIGLKSELGHGSTFYCRFKTIEKS